MIHLYAEHLLNIRTLSIQASLSTVSNRETNATLSADGRVLTLTHEGEQASVILPINLSPRRESTVQLTIPAVPSRELSFRVSLEEKDGVSDSVLGSTDPSEEGNIIPWTANSLTPDTEICCKDCDGVLIQRGQIREWKDLPSEGWAEIMDFWHCHKPDEPQSHEHAHSKKGYAASSQLALRPGVAMVGVVDFLFAPEDCHNIKILQSRRQDSTTPATLLCSECDFVLGQVDSSSQGGQLRKSQVSITTMTKAHIVYPTEKWFACLLLSAMENQGVRKFVVHESGTSIGKALKAWIFLPDLSVSSSMKSSHEFVRVCKVMWQDHEGTAQEADSLNGAALSEGEVKIQRGTLELLREHLALSAAVLPEEARTFQGWNVGLLERFTKRDLI